MMDETTSGKLSQLLACASCGETLPSTQPYVVVRVESHAHLHEPRRVMSVTLHAKCYERSRARWLPTLNGADKS
jgi:hypothetical protein